MTISVDFFLCFRRRRVRRLDLDLDLDLGLLDRLALQTTTTTKSARLLRCSCFSFGGYIYKQRDETFLEKKKEENVPQKENPPPTTPGEDAKKKVYIIIWEADVLPLHHKRVVENNTPSTFRRELFIHYIVYASRKSNPRLQLFLLSLKEEEEEEENTKFIQFLRLSLGFSI